MNQGFNVISNAKKLATQSIATNVDVKYKKVTDYYVVSRGYLIRNMKNKNEFIEHAFLKVEKVGVKLIELQTAIDNLSFVLCIAEQSSLRIAIEKDVNMSALVDLKLQIEELRGMLIQFNGQNLSLN